MWLMPQDDVTTTTVPAELAEAPLAGVRVIDFTQFVAGPAATQVLVDLGADVIKVEPPTGESTREVGLYGEAMMHLTNRGKRAVAIDLASERGRDVAWRLIATADIVVQNLRPGVMEKFGLDASSVRERHPHLVYGNVSGFGPRGPSRYRAGFDVAAQAESGLMWVTGERQGDPLRIGAPAVDAASAHVLAQALLAAYIKRLRFGSGDTVEVSLLEVGIHLQGPNWTEYFLSGVEPRRMGNGQSNIAPAADVVRTADGAMLISAYSPVHWERFCKLIDRPDLLVDSRFTSNADRVAHRPELLAELAPSFVHRTTDDALHLLTSNGLVAGRVAEYPDVLANPDVQAAGLFVETGEGAEASRTMRSPWHLESVPETLHWPEPCPTLGQHTAELLGELGISEVEIDELQRAGVIATRA